MSGLTDPLRARCRHHLVAVLAMLAAVAASPYAWSQPMLQQPTQQKSVIIQVAPAQDPPVPVQSAPAELAPAQSASPVPPVPENPGLINEIGKMFKNSNSLLPALPAWPSLGTDSLTRLNTVVKGRMVCPVAANGAPDCKTASDKLCQSKGFKEGKSLDTDAAQSCSAKAMIPGRKPEEGDCRTDNYVTQALCQ